ncbi:hypothetical protein GOP47_0010744 [Adiantum capillus-veneris]|uniref:Uncharacterized protein n=1 Tax=Adiantum capillus-veneris TaxID=13818 RepID=A0A9D4ZGM9_ADICA|nr:hypothetical protein GOP47_0010744 [Adiantum capillus-veneris]
MLRGSFSLRPFHNIIWCALPLEYLLSGGQTLPNACALRWPRRITLLKISRFEVPSVEVEGLMDDEAPFKLAKANTSEHIVYINELRYAFCQSMWTVALLSSCKMILNEMALGGQ